MKDQCVARQWIQKYISKSRGDSTEVAIFGEFAGSMAISIHMLLNDGNNEGLFRAAIMMSGGPSKFSDYHRGQETFNTIVNTVGCGSAPDKIACLRTVDYNARCSAVHGQSNSLSYESTLVPWYPRAIITSSKLPLMNYPAQERSPASPTSSAT